MRLALNSMELEVQRLLQHLDRTQARRFLVNPEPPSGFIPLEEEAEWRVIPSNAAYDISAYGVIRRRERAQGSRIGAILRPHPNNKGYLQIGLAIGSGETLKRTVHTLVAEAYLGPRPEGLWVLHNDGDRLNNHYTNLRYGTPQENVSDMYAHGTAMVGEAHYNSRLTTEQVLRIRADTRSYAETAADHGISTKYVWKVKAGKTWKAVGFAAFSELKDDAIGRAQRAAKKQESDPFYADLNERLAKEEARFGVAK